MHACKQVTSDITKLPYTRKTYYHKNYYPH